MVITYIIADVKGPHEYQAGWQMNEATYNQWKTAIEEVAHFCWRTARPCCTAAYSS